LIECPIAHVGKDQSCQTESNFANLTFSPASAHNHYILNEMAINKPSENALFCLSIMNSILFPN
jgi:hypothetical protein